MFILFNYNSKLITKFIQINILQTDHEVIACKLTYIHKKTDYKSPQES